MGLCRTSNRNKAPTAEQTKSAKKLSKKDKSKSNELKDKTFKDVTPLKKIDRTLSDIFGPNNVFIPPSPIITIGEDKKDEQALVVSPGNELAVAKVKPWFEVTDEDMTLSPYDSDDELRTYATMEEFMTDCRLKKFEIAFFNLGCQELRHLGGCSDEYLTNKIKLKAAQIYKFRRGLQKGGLSRFKVVAPGIYEASDGAQGTYDELLQHMKDLAEERFAKLRKVVLTQNYVRKKSAGRVFSELMAIKRARDAEEARQATKIQSLARQKLGVKAADKQRWYKDLEKVHVVTIYEASDGFRGTYEEVEAHEKKLGAGDHLFDITHTHEALQGNSNTKALFHSEEDDDELVTRLFEAPDGFRGTFDQVLEHEAKLGIVHEDDTEQAGRRVYAYEVLQLRSDLHHMEHNNGQIHEQIKKHAEPKEDKTNQIVMAEDVREEKDPGEAEVIYETDDGFRGTHDEMVAHEERRKHLMYEEHKKEMEAQIQALKEENQKKDENVGQLESLAAEHKEMLDQKTRSAEEKKKKVSGAGVNWRQHLAEAN